MKRLFVTALLAVSHYGAAAAAPSTDPAKMPAGTYSLEKTHASLIAKARHMGLTSYTMRFNSFDAAYVWDPKAPQDAKVTVTIDTTSLDVGDPKISEKFANDFLDAKDHPKATFVSTAINRAEGASTGTITGDFTFRGVTRPLTLNVDFRGYESGIFGARSGFSATAHFKRSDFGSSNLTFVVADDIDLVIEVEFLKK